MNFENKEKIKSLMKDDFPEGRMSDEFLFSPCAVDYIFHKGNIGKEDIKKGFIDGAGDRGIDFVHVDDEEGIVYLVQGKSSSSLTVRDVEDAIDKIQSALTDLENGVYDKFSSNAVSILLNAIDAYPDNINFVICTSTSLQDNEESDIGEYVNNNLNLTGYDVFVYDKESIEEIIQEQLLDDQYVKESTLTIFPQENREDNKLLYSDNGAIVNVSASSIKKLYKQYNKKGLFGYNLREFVSQSKIDSKIQATIKEDNKSFWYLNNGITIGCQKFEFVNDKIRLVNFSIINGAQTTSNIGTSKYVRNDNDFAVIAKIVKTNDGVVSDSEFIERISEASNSQKPIKDRDLKSNSKEQRELQSKGLANRKKLAIEIKRGNKPNVQGIEKWQNITNERLAQFILSFIKQSPGTARSNKKEIFSNVSTYKEIFITKRDKYDIDSLYDITKIAHQYDSYKTNYIENTPEPNDPEDITKLAIVNNGQLTIIAVIGFIYKRLYKHLGSYSSSSLGDFNIRGDIIKQSDETKLEESLNKLFDRLVKEISKIYSNRRVSLNVSNETNFLKRDDYYKDEILRIIDNDLIKDEDMFNALLKGSIESVFGPIA